MLPRTNELQYGLSVGGRVLKMLVIAAAAGGATFVSPSNHSVLAGTCLASGQPLSTTAAGVLGNNRSSAPSVDGNGGLVAFESDATNFGSTNAVRNIWVKDVCSGALTLATQSTSGVEANGSSYAASIDAAGDTVVFDSFANNLAAGGTLHEQVYAHRLDTGATTLVSDTALGKQGNRNCTAPVISPDGRYVTFQSASTNFGGSTAGNWNIYVKDMTTGALKVVTNTSTGNSLFPWISAGGGFVSFYSSANFGQATSFEQVYRHDMTTGQTLLVSAAAGSPGNGNSTLPSMSADGRYVVFDTAATNLVSGSSGRQVILHDVSVGTNTLVSHSPSNGPGNAGSGVAWIDANGSAVAFVSAATNLVSGVASHSLYLYTLSTGAIQAFITPAPASGPTVDAAGDTLAVTVTPKTTTHSVPGTSAGPGSQVYLERAA
jgi:Tol biopolymer transport system component